MIVNVSVAPGAAHDPRAAVDLLDAAAPAAAASFDVHDVARELAQQIAARDPRRQARTAARGWVVDAALDLEVVPIEIGETNAIADQSGSPA